jgi:hypothetical protein
MRSACLLLLALLAAGCDDTPTAPTAPVNQDVTLAPGERVSFASSFSLQFMGVTGDSRCPADTICVLGGDAIVRLEARRPNDVAGVLELHTAQPQSVTYGPYTITLVELSPYPFVARPISPDEYRATIRVTR